MEFHSKAETLENLYGRLKYARVLPQLRFSVENWDKHRDLKKIFPSFPDWFAGPVIVRSSGATEDTEGASLAGHFESVLNVHGQSEIEGAIRKVSASFEDCHKENQIFIQPMLNEALYSGVAFTREASGGGYYYVVNYDAETGATDSVTSGTTNSLVALYIFKKSMPKEDWQQRLVLLLQELEEVFDNDALDVEFAILKDGSIVLLQVRPLAMPLSNVVAITEHQEALNRIAKKVDTLSQKHPYLLGDFTVFGNMPDWNPAEMIGTRPKPFGLSLYKELLTDNIWAYQRDNYGYRNLRSFPLMVSFCGQPYIDVRISFNSFIPRDLDEKLAKKLVNYYLSQLLNKPKLHDKIEFDIIYSCYSLDLPERLKSLENQGFTELECRKICDSLRNLTNSVVRKDTGLWQNDITKLSELRERQKLVLSSELAPIDKIYWLLEDCKRYGTLPFAGLARAGFIAIQFLKSFVSKEVFSQADYDRYMESLNTISSDMSKDLVILSKEAFLDKYGHLRPGTYDLLSPRYDEAPDQYFDWHDIKVHPGDKKSEFSLSLMKLNQLQYLLQQHNLDLDVLSLFDFIKGAIEGREFAKFIFTKSLSEALRLFKEYGKTLGFEEHDLVFANVNCIRDIYSSSSDPREVIQSYIDEGKKAYDLTKIISLPSLITGSDNIHSYEEKQQEPNFVTLKSAIGLVTTETSPKETLINSILMIPSADPGFDWVFSHKIAGFITMYGGVNSHMAIRAAELGIPAIVGAGEVLYQKWSTATSLKIDCAHKQVHQLK